ncbi:biotin--[acetyl-CoA-carboxylase] ligase [Microbacterium sp.]|uniref:biotin--[acetyl-CoA-carboxylase] ligase n=1 Tax=Microbacterium sp. TaxID=51671 RepID=UPI0039E519BA
MTHEMRGYPLAAAVSPRLHVMDAVDSTNAKLARDAQDDPDGHPHLSVVLTHDQRAGRGRLDRTWTTPPGSAIAVSVLLRVGAVAPADRGWIPLLAGVAMAEAVAAQLGGLEVTVKWPNDVLVEGRKISGILAEVLPGDPHTVVLGAGVNTAMTAEQLPVPTATSFAALGRDCRDDRLLEGFLTGLRDRIAALAVGGGAAVAAGVAARCATLGSEVVVSLPGGASLRGVARRLDEAGRLVVEARGGEADGGETGGVETVVGAGDVVHVR